MNFFVLEGFDFLFVCPGDIVIIVEDLATCSADSDDWWAGHVLRVIGGARDPSANSLFQVANVDTGIVRTINADLVKKILIPRMSNKIK